MSTVYGHPGSPLRRVRRRTALPIVLAVGVALVLLVVAGGAWLAAPGQARIDSPGTARSPVAAVGEPTRIQITAIGVDAPLVPVGLRPDGAMQTPDFGLAAWYKLGPRPGEPGPAVVLAHVDSMAGPDVFFRLKELRTGDAVVVHHEQGSVRFVVESTEQVRKENLPAGRIWNRTDKPVLRLVTCGGEFDRTAGSYRDNIIVYASLDSTGP